MNNKPVQPTNRGMATNTLSRQQGSFTQSFVLRSTKEDIQICGITPGPRSEAYQNAAFKSLERNNFILESGNLSPEGKRKFRNSPHASELYAQADERFADWATDRNAYTARAKWISERTKPVNKMAKATVLQENEDLRTENLRLRRELEEVAAADAAQLAPADAAQPAAGPLNDTWEGMSQTDPDNPFSTPVRGSGQAVYPTPDSNHAGPSRAGPRALENPSWLRPNGTAHMGIVNEKEDTSPPDLACSVLSVSDATLLKITELEHLLEERRSDIQDLCARIQMVGAAAQVGDAQRLHTQLTQALQERDAYRNQCADMMLELRDRVEELESEQRQTLYSIGRIQRTENLLKAAQASEGETQNRLREAELSRTLYVRRAAELVQEVERLKVVIRLHASAMLEASN